MSGNLWLKFSNVGGCEEWREKEDKIELKEN